MDTITKIQVFGPYGNMGEGARITFGDHALCDNLNVLVGELGITDCDKLWMHGKRGHYFTVSSNAKDTVAYFDIEKGRYFQFNCDVRSSGVFIKSDERFKENISPISSSANGLNKLTAVSYRLKPELSPSMQARSNASLTEKEQRDNADFAKFYNQQEPVRFGFVAQEVKEVYPELVRKDSLGYMYVDYIGMIPLLVNAVNELTAKTDSLETVIQTLQAEQNGQVNRPFQMNSGIEGLATEDCVLSQNIPNPFNVSTEIKCTLPYTAKQAELYVYDLQGAQKLVKPIEGRGDTSVLINAGDLTAGMYIYTLIVDGAAKGSYQMILTE